MWGGTAKYILTIFIQWVIGILLYLLGSCWILNSEALIYFICYICTAIVSLSIMAFVNPQTLAERNKKNTDSPIWDKLLLGCFWLLGYYLIYLIAGIESRGSGVAGGIIFWFGIFLNLLAGAVTLWALIENTFLEDRMLLEHLDGYQVYSNKVKYRLLPFIW